MGTSNWQNIPFCIDVLMKIAPARALDVGVGFGRWGVILREFCDVWGGRVHASDWKIEVHGIEGFEKNISDYHRAFYTKIHVGDANDLIPRLPGPWNVVIFGDVLEHFTKEAGRAHLETCLARSDYVLVNVPLGEDWQQGDAYGNAFERHRSSWYADEFLDYHAVRQALFRDYLGRPFGSFVLSTADPKGLRQAVYSRAPAYHDLMIVEPRMEELDRLLDAVDGQATELSQSQQLTAVLNQELEVTRDRVSRGAAELAAARQRATQHATELWSVKQSAAGQAAELGKLRQRWHQQSGELARVQRQAAEHAAELAYIKQHSTYRLGERLRSSTVWNAARWFKTRNRRVVGVRATGEHNPESQGNEIWLLRAEPNAGQAPVPWDFIESDRSWERRLVHDRPYGQCLHSQSGLARVPVDADPHLQFLAHQWSGRVEVTFQGRREEIDLYSPGSRTVSVYPARTPMVVRDIDPASTPAAGTEPGTGPALAGEEPLRGVEAPAVEEGKFSEREEAWIESMRSQNAQLVAIHCPRWLGVTSSTRGLFEHLYPVPALKSEDPYTIKDDLLEHHADVLAASGVKHFVFSGGDKYQLRMIEMLHRRVSGLRCDGFWHASYVQFVEDYTWELTRLWVDAARAGVVYCIATAKAGQERFFRSLGVRSSVLLNRVDGGLHDPPELPADEHHVGLWLSGTTYRKIPHAMLSALAMLPGVRLHAAGVDPRSREVIQYLGIATATASEKQLPHDELMPAMRRTHATMYVTFVECCPMLPLESLAQGVPCLTGPNSHLFEDHRYLFERLVVPFPDRAEVIADYLTRAINERHDIIRAYREYHPLYQERCRKSVEEFMAL